jgi:ABC-type uncharacterized transport system permease subunit
MQKLSKLDWRVLFLGFGLGGCFGLATILGMVSLITAGASWYAAIAITIGLLHGIILAVLWRSRERIQLRTGLRLALLASAVGLLTIQFVRHQLEVKDTAANSLYMLAFMQSILAFVHPMVLTSGATVGSDKA